MYSSLLQRLYQQVLILDLEYALDRKVEQELWNHGFKNYIATLQNLAKDKKVCSDVKEGAVLYNVCVFSLFSMIICVLQVEREGMYVCFCFVL